MKYPKLEPLWDHLMGQVAKIKTLYDEGRPIFDEGQKLQAKGRKDKDEALRLHGFGLCKKGMKLIDESNFIRACNSGVYEKAVIEAYGKEAVIDWKTGEIDL